MCAFASENREVLQGQARNVFGKKAVEKCSLLCQRALTQKQTLWGSGALERGHRASLERLAELGDALGSVGALSILDAAQRVVGQAVSMTKEACQGALTREGGFERHSAYSSTSNVKLPLRPSARAAAPSGPRTFSRRLRARERRRVLRVSMGADTKANTRGGMAREPHDDAVAGKQAGLSVLRACSLRHS